MAEPKELSPAALPFGLLVPPKRVDPVAVAVIIISMVVIMIIIIIITNTMNGIGSYEGV